MKGGVLDISRVEDKAGVLDHETVINAGVIGHDDDQILRSKIFGRERLGIQFQILVFDRRHVRVMVTHPSPELF